MKRLLLAVVLLMVLAVGRAQCGGVITPGQFNLNCYNDLVQLSTPAKNPPTGYIRFYAKTASTVCTLTSGGTETCLAASGNATTINGASVPASQGCLGTNSSSQLIAGSCGTQTATVTLSPSQIKESNAVDTVTSITVSGANMLLTGVFTNCSIANALNGGWYTITGSNQAANNITTGPVSACTVTTLTLPNPSAVADTASITATNTGFQALAGQGAGTIAIPVDWMTAQYIFGTTPYTITDADQPAFLLNYAAVAIPLTAFPVFPSYILGEYLVDQSVNTPAIATGAIIPSGIPSSSQINSPIILQWWSVVNSAFEPAPTLGDGSVRFKFAYVVVTP